MVEIGPEVGNLKARGGESGRDLARGAGGPRGAEGSGGGRFSGFQIFRKRTFESRVVNG